MNVKHTKNGRLDSMSPLHSYTASNIFNDANINAFRPSPLKICHMVKGAVLIDSLVYVSTSEDEE